MKKALITGITGQDGSYLADFLLYQGYEVHGIIRRSSSLNTHRIDHIFDRLHLHHADLTDTASLTPILATVAPDEIYNLGAQSHVRVSYDVPGYTHEAAGLGAFRLFDTVRALLLPARIYQAGSSEMFGGLFDGNTHLNEQCRFHPRSPYACAKVFAHHCAVNYREAYGMFICNGILFNHESPRRGETFVTRKIVRYVADLVRRQTHGPLKLGNLTAKRDWGYAPEYVCGMWRMLQQDRPRDYVLATGEAHSVQDFAVEAFRCVGEEPRVEFDERLLRPAEVDVLLGDYMRAAHLLQWTPRTYFKKLVHVMVKAELDGVEEDLDETWRYYGPTVLR